jgi:hypothetical protein
MWTIAIVLLAGCGSGGCRKEPSQKQPRERYAPVYSSHVDPGTRELYASSGPWTEALGAGEFGVVERGRELQLFPAGDDVYAARHPYLYRLDGARLVRVELPDAGPLHEGRPWVVEQVWADPVKGTCLWIDELRHYGGPSTVAKYFRLANGAWVSDPSVSTLGGSSQRQSDDRAYKYEAVAGGRDAVSRADGGALPALPYRDTYAARLLSRNGRLVYVTNGARPNDAKYTVDSVMIATWDGKEWKDDGAHLDGMNLANAALLDDGTLYVLLAENGNGISGSSSRRGPSPSGELNRRRPDGKWERLSFPCHELPDKWTCLRFAPQDMATTRDGGVWVTGRWFYTRHPDPTTLQTFVFGGLFRLGAKDAEIIELE